MVVFGGACEHSGEDGWILNMGIANGLFFGKIANIGYLLWFEFLQALKFANKFENTCFILIAIQFLVFSS